MNDYHEEKQKIGIPAIGIPGEVAFNHFLTDKEKILFGFIRNLSRSRKGCWASNRYLGNLIRAKPQTISGAITKLKKYKYIKTILKLKKGGTAEQIRSIFIDESYSQRYQVLVPLWDDILVQGNMTDPDKQMEFLSQIIESCRINENLFKSIPPMIQTIGGIDQIIRKEDTEEDIKIDTTISKDIVNRVSGETQNDLNKKTPRRVKRKPEPKQVRRRKPPVTNILPRYIIKIISKWNSYPSTTSHKLDIEKPSKTIQGIHRYLIQLKTGKMSGLKESWIKDSKIPRSFLTRKWTEEELLQGIEYLSKFSQNDYWPKDGKDNFKNLSNLLYNTSTKKSLFLKVMNNPPEKISVKMEIKHPIKTARFMKADIWANDNKPSEYDLDRQLKSVVDFFIYLRPYVAPTEACMGYDLSHGEEPKLHTYFYDNYISFLENTPIMLKNANPQPLSSVGWAFKAYIADIWDDLPHIDSVINPVKLLEKFNRGDK